MSAGNDNWRRHEVPTFTQVEDSWIFGLGLKQIMGVVIAISVGFAIYQFASFSFLPGNVRIGLAVGCGIIGVGIVVVRPGGRSVFSLALDVFRFWTRSKEHCELLNDLVSLESLDDKKKRVEEERDETERQEEELARAERGEDDGFAAGDGLKGKALAAGFGAKKILAAAPARALGLIKRNANERDDERDDEEKVDVQRAD